MSILKFVNLGLALVSMGLALVLRYNTIVVILHMYMHFHHGLAL
jgi:hypothetical protein